MKKIIIASDSFKESMDAKTACLGIKEGFDKVFFDNYNPVIIPMADGGEGTMEVIISQNNGEYIQIPVHDPQGNIINAAYGFLGNEKTAIIECAQACGLSLLPVDKRQPLELSTYGVGELIAHAIKNGAETIIIGLGGSSTCDCGLGMLKALGANGYDSDGNEIEPKPKEFGKLRGINIDKALELTKSCKIIIACDVENPLLGANGMVYTFAKQKGATEKMLPILEEKVYNFNEIIKKDLGIDLSDKESAGAAGGLGGALFILKGELISGVDLILKYTNFEEKIKGASYIITGEGSVDSQSKYGKTISGIAKIAKKHKIPLIALAGMVSDDISELYDIGITAIFSITDSAKSLSDALKDGEYSIIKTSENIARLIKCSLD